MTKTTTRDNTTTDRYRSLLEREYSCETCGREPRDIHASGRDGADLLERKQRDRDWTEVEP